MKKVFFVLVFASQAIFAMESTRTSYIKQFNEIESRIRVTTEKSIFPFFLAMHTRIGSESPAGTMSPYTFQDIWDVAVTENDTGQILAMHYPCYHMIFQAIYRNSANSQL